MSDEVRDAGAGIIDRAFYIEGDTPGLSFRSLTAIDELVAAGWTPPGKVVPVLTFDEVREVVRKAAEENDLLVCVRDWSAWGVGTMGAGDFEAVDGEDDCLDDITKTLLDAITPQKRDWGQPPTD